MASYLTISKHWLNNRKGSCLLFVMGMAFLLLLYLRSIDLLTVEIGDFMRDRKSEFSTRSLSPDGTDGFIQSNVTEKPCDRKHGCGNSPDEQNERRILIGGDHCIKYTLNGTLFGVKGTSRVLNKEVEMCHLKSFEAISGDFRTTFLELDNNFNFSFSSPSFLWVDNKLALTMRLKFHSKVFKGCYNYLCNQIHFGYYDKYLRPIGQPDIITLRTPYIPSGRAQIRMGPHDGKLLQLNNSLYSLFATGSGESWISSIWDFQRQQFFTPRFEKLLMNTKRIISEKNWVPVVVKDELYIIRYLDPLQVMKCKIHEDCRFVHNNTDASASAMDDRTSPLRGGTEFKEYQYPYYISIAHATYVNMEGKRTYEAYLVVMCVDPFRIVYVSDKLHVKEELFKGTKPRWQAVVGDFIFPTGLIIEDKDSVVIGAHANDAFSMLLRLKGIQPIVESVIESDKSSTHQNKDFVIQNFLREQAIEHYQWLKQGYSVVK